MYGRTQTVHYEQVSRQSRKVGKCSICQKRTERSKTFTHTINPFNKNKEGSVKTYGQVRADVIEEMNAWKPDFDHDKCRDMK